MLVLLSRLLCALPLPAAVKLAHALAWIWYHLLPIRRSVAHANVRRALGTTMSPRAQRRIVRHCFSHQALYAIEVLRAPIMTRAVSEALVERVGFEHLDAALAEGRGVIAFMAHIGNIDMVGFSQAVRGVPISVVVKELHWGPAQQFVTLVRERTGMRLISARRSKDVILRALSDNQIVPLVVDQHMAPHRAIVATFFQQLASTSPAVARFALETGAPVHPAVVRRTGLGPKHVITIEPRFNIETPYADHDANIRHNTQRINDHIENWIRETPEQWLWLHQRWKAHDNPTGWDVPPEVARRVRGATDPLETRQ